MMKEDDSGLAKLHFLDADFDVIHPGRYVLCAVSGVEIPLECLVYWNVDQQEAYAGPPEAMQRWQELHALPEGADRLSGIDPEAG